MNVQKLLVTTLVGGVFAFFFGWLVFGIIFKDAMPAGMSGLVRAEADMVMWAMVLSNLLWGLLMAYIFIAWANVTDWMAGLKAGAILGLLIAASYDTGFYAMTTMFTMKDIIMDVVLNTFFVGIMGAVVGWWLGRK